jgi:putative PEP-CTERM system TPR-repeat lipoprotein
VKKLVYAAVLISIFSLVSGCSQEPDVEEYIKSGQEYLDKKEWNSAIIEFKNAAKEAPENANARALLGKTYVHSQNAKAAIKELNKAIELGYDKVELLVPLGMAYRQARENQKIIDEIIPHESQSDSDRAVVNAFRAVAFLMFGDKASAKSSLEKARDQDGEATEVRLAWATFENVNGNIEAQERWLQPLLTREGGVAEAWAQMGEIEQARGNLESAERSYSRAIDIRKAPHYDYIRRALARIALGNTEGAESDIDFLKKSGANWPLVSHAEGLIDYNAKNYADAQAHFLEVLSKNPSFAPSQLMTGLSYFHQQNYRSTITYLDQYFVSNPDNDQVQQVYAASLLATGSVKKALGVLEGLYKKDPNNTKILMLLSEAYLREGKNVESLEYLQRAVKISPDQASTRFQLGTTLIRNPDTVTVGQLELKKALELDPSLLQAKLNLFKSYLRQKQFKLALETAQEIQSSNQDKSLGANLVALVYSVDGKDDKAKKQLIDTLKKFPLDLLTSHNLARIYMREKAYDDARALYLKVIEKQPNNTLLLQQMALISAREGNPGEMLEWLRKAVDRNPKQIRPRLALASQYLQQRNPADAIKTLNDVDEKDKDRPEFLILMSRAKIVTGEQEHALRLLKRLTGKQPDAPVGHFLLAQVYAAQNNLAKMRKSLVKTIELSPKHLMANIFLSRLDMLEGKEKAFESRLAMLEENYPGNVQVELLKAQKSSLSKDFDSAIEALTGLLSETPQSDVVIELSRNQWRSGDRQGAISTLELWSENNKDNQVLLLLAQYYLLENRSNEATVTYEALEQELPDDSRVLNNLAWSLKDSDPSKGIEYARKAERLDTGNPLILDTLAMLLLKVGDKEAALDVIEKAISKAPRAFDIHLNYADILVANNQINRAKKVLEEILKQSTDKEQKRVVSERLDNL